MPKHNTLRNTTLKNKIQQQGFTLVEIMVVVVILGILAGIVIPKVINRPDEARATRIAADIASISQAVELYRVDNSRYPTTDQGLEALITKPNIAPEPKNWNNDGYLSKLPEDPWGETYLYLSPGEHGRFDIYTLGADGVQGGTEADKDIGNWDE